MNLANAGFILCSVAWGTCLACGKLPWGAPASQDVTFVLEVSTAVLLSLAWNATGEYLS